MVLSAIYISAIPHKHVWLATFRDIPVTLVRGFLNTTHRLWYTVVSAESAEQRPFVRYIITHVINENDTPMM